MKTRRDVERRNDSERSGKFLDVNGNNIGEPAKTNGDGQMDGANGRTFVKEGGRFPVKVEVIWGIVPAPDVQRTELAVSLSSQSQIVHSFAAKFLNEVEAIFGKRTDQFRHDLR